jgi:hypothetical protein
VSLSWCQPVGNGDVAYYGYDVYQGTAVGQVSTLVNGSPLDITVTGYDVTGLTAGTTYYFKVEALYSLSGDQGGLWSNEVPATLPAAASPPGTPTGLTATPGRASVNLAWIAPKSDGGSPITGYNVDDGTSPASESETPVATVDATSVTVLADGCAEAEVADGLSEPGGLVQGDKRVAVVHLH